MYQTVMISVILVYLFLYFILSVRTKTPFKTMLFYAFLGVVTLAIIKLTSPFSGVNIPLNGYTLGASAVLSIPGTIMLLILRVIFI